MHFAHPRAYCLRCRFRREVCLCAATRQAAADLRLVVVLHAVEERKMSNTGHLAALVLPDARIAVHGRRDQAVDLAELRETHAPDGRPWRSVLLFPGLGAEPLDARAVADLRAPDHKLRLVVPDGTWSQARRMVRRLPELAALPRYTIPFGAAWASRTALRPRGNPEPARVSTCEAIATAFGLLGEPDAEAALQEVYDAAALRIAMMRGKVLVGEHRDLIVKV
jgi:DTW domain-containing protein YfiP